MIMPRLRPTMIAPGLGAATLTIGCLVFAGWILDVEWLTSISPRFIVMLPNTAIGMMLAGVGVIAASRLSERSALVARVLGAATVTLGIVSLLERLGGWDFRVNRWLFAESLARYPYRPLGLMATNSAVSFALGGAALLLLMSPRLARRRAGRRLAAAGLAIATLALLGHLYGARPLFSVDRAAGMALLSAIAFS